MKYLLALILLGLSLPPGILAALNIYYIFKTSGVSGIPAPEMGQYAMTGGLTLIAILLFIGGISVASTKEES